MLDAPVVMRRTSQSTVANKGFNDADVAEYRAVFNYFDDKNTGKMTANQVAMTLRSLKPMPDEKMVAKIKETYSNGCDFNQFLDSLHIVIRSTAKKHRRKTMYTNPISEERRAEMKDAFDTFDYDQDGTISLNELTTVMASCGIYINDDEACDILNEFGHQHNSSDTSNLNFEEFIQLMSTKEGGEVKNEILEAFNFFDKDGDGRISHEELTTVMLALGEDIRDGDIYDMIQEASGNGSGTVCYQDFLKMMTGSAK